MFSFGGWEIETLSDNRAQGRQVRRLTSVLAVDICGYSTLSEKNEPVAVKVVNAFHSILGTSCEKFGGRIFHQAGDGFFAEYGSANDCLLSALDLLEQVSSLSKAAEGYATGIRVGLHVGDVVDQPGGDLLGHGVNIAARLQAEANVNGILASVNLVNLVASSSDGRFKKRGQLHLKNMQEPVEAYDVESGQEKKLWARMRLSSKGQTALSFAGVAALIVVGIIGLGSILDLSFNKEGSVSGLVSKSIDRRAIRGATDMLVEANKPIDAAVFALLETGGFDEAIEYLSLEYTSNLNQLSAPRRIELLHQIGALAFDRDIEIAQRAYRQILAIDKTEPLAAAKLARIHLSRSERREARHLIGIALNAPNLSPSLRLRFEIDQALISAPPYGLAADTLAELADKARAQQNPIELLARTYEISFRSVAVGSANLDPTLEFGKLSDRLALVIERQEELNLDIQLTVSYSQMGFFKLQAGELSIAQAMFERILTIENILDRPARKLDPLANLAKVYFDLGELDLAEEYNNAGITLALELDILSRLHFNHALSARINFARGNVLEACEQMSEAIFAWPNDTASRAILRREHAGFGCDQ